MATLTPAQAKALARLAEVPSMRRSDRAGPYRMHWKVAEALERLGYVAPAEGYGDRDMRERITEAGREALERMQTT